MCLVPTFWGRCTRERGDFVLLLPYHLTCLAMPSSKTHTHKHTWMPCLTKSPSSSSSYASYANENRHVNYKSFQKRKAAYNNNNKNWGNLFWHTIKWYEKVRKVPIQEEEDKIFHVSYFVKKFYNVYRNGVISATPTRFVKI